MAAIDTSNIIEEWLTKQNLEDFTLILWNDKAQNGEIIENNGEYNISNDNRVILYTPTRYDYLELKPNAILKDRRVRLAYSELILDFVGKQDIHLIQSVDGEEKTYHFALNKDVTESEKNDFLLALGDGITGDEWVIAMLGHLSEVKFIVWNDDSGMKKILEDGEEYQMSPNDMFAIYYPSEAIKADINPKDAIKGKKYSSRRVVLNFDFDTYGKSIEFAAHIVLKSGDEYNLSATVLAPVE